MACFGRLGLIVLALLGMAIAQDTGGKVIQVTDQNFDHMINEYEVVLVNFYANWCRFSQMLSPIYDQAAKLLGDSVNARLAKVDCEDRAAVNTKNNNRITKYPTIKVFRNGKPLKTEYRGQRSATAIEAFVRQLLSPPVVVVESQAEIKPIVDAKKHVVVGHFNQKGHSGRSVFDQVANALRDDCTFVAFEGSENVGPDGWRFIFEQHGTEAKYDQDLEPQQFLAWAKEECSPLVKEITFDNAEELTEQGLPFIIMFYDPNNKKPIQDFMTVVKDRFAKERERVNFITADGSKFTHPLQHLGKSRKDLPILAADTFRHMYLFKNYKRMFKEGPLEQFIDDMFTGKLHHDLHNPPTNVVTPDPYAEVIDEPAEATKSIPRREASGNDDKADDADDDRKDTIKEKLENVEVEKKKAEEAAETVQKHEEKIAQKTAVDPHAEETDDDEVHKPVRVSSVLNKLAPSENRYSFVRNRDEL